MAVMSQYLDKSELLVSRRNDVMEASIELMKTQPEIFNGRKGTKADISKRIDAFDSMIKTIIQ